MNGFEQVITNMQLTKRIRLKEEKIKRPTKELQIQFDDPPGPSPARIAFPLYGLEPPVSSLRKDLQEKVSDIVAGGVTTRAFTGENYTILWLALGGIAGGFLGAVGQDIWNALKKACKNIIQRNWARRYVVEIALGFKDLDVVLHYESRNLSGFPDMLDDADLILQELKNALSQKNIEAKTVELRLCHGRKTYDCVLYSYRRCKKMIQIGKKKDNA